MLPKFLNVEFAQTQAAFSVPKQDSALTIAQAGSADHLPVPVIIAELALTTGRAIHLVEPAPAKMLT